MQFRAGRTVAERLVGPQRRPCVDDEMVRHEYVFEFHAVRSRRAHAERGVAAPVAENGVLPARHDENLGDGRRIAVLECDIADEMRGIGNARAVIPHAVDDITAICFRAGRRDCADTVWSTEIAIRAEQFKLRAFRPVARHQQAVGCGERQAPADAGVAARDLQHHAIEYRIVELIAAEHFRLKDAIKARLADFHFHFFGMAAARVVFGLRFAQRWPQRGRALDQHFRGHARIGSRQRIGRFLGSVFLSGHFDP